MAVWLTATGRAVARSYIQGEGAKRKPEGPNPIVKIVRLNSIKENILKIVLNKNKFNSTIFKWNNISKIEKNFENFIAKIEKNIEKFITKSGEILKIVLNINRI